MSNASEVTVLTQERCEVECLHPEHVAPLLGRVIDYAAADELASTFAVLADPTRSRILHALSLADELCVCDLALLLGISQSALSHQLRLLRDRRVVARRKAGRIVYYRLADEHVRHVFSDGLRHVSEVETRHQASTVA
jgi:ArsR family transcriptional regulator